MNNGSSVSDVISCVMASDANFLDVSYLLKHKHLQHEFQNVHMNTFWFLSCFQNSTKRTQLETKKRHEKRLGAG